MKFPKVDVRENLLSTAAMRGARIVEQVELRMDGLCRSNRALLALARGQAAMNTYRVEVARVAYADGITHARDDHDDLLLACAITLQALLLDGISSAGPLPALRDAREALLRDIAATQESLMDRRCKREEALSVMQPRCDLLELIDHNIAQYELQRSASQLHESKKFADSLIAQRKPETALQVATTAAENAKNMLGRDHWLVAVMDVRRALAMFLLGRHDEVAKLARGVIATFEEWSSGEDVDNAFRVDCLLMRQAVAGQLVMV